MEYLTSGIKVTINTDDLAVVGTRLSKEYQYMEETYGLTPKQKLILLKNAVEGAFTTDSTKAELKAELGI